MADELTALIERLNSWPRDKYGNTDAIKMALIMDDAAAALTTLREENARMREALRKLSNEVGGLRAFEFAVRDAISNTNWEVLMLRISEADAALSALEEGNA